MRFSIKAIVVSNDLLHYHLFDDVSGQVRSPRYLLRSFLTILLPFLILIVL